MLIVAKLLMLRKRAIYPLNTLITFHIVKMSEYNRFRAMTKSYFLKPLFDYFLKIKSNDFFLNFKSYSP